jgi:ribonuclease I
MQVTNDVVLHATMQQIWSGLTNTMPNQRFWEHQWVAHRAYSNFNQHEYFKTTCDRANALQGLNQAG